MNNHIEKQYESLDSSNRLVADQMIQKLMDMQSKAELNFQKIKSFDMIKLPANYPNVFEAVQTIKKCNNLKNLKDYKSKIVDQLKNVKTQIDLIHNQNIESINSNKELRNKIMELFSYIGVRDEYTELQHKGMKIKTVTKEAGYLSDLNVFCKIDDGYKSIMSKIDSNINEIENEFTKASHIIAHNEDVEYKTKVFYSLNKYAITHNIEINSMFKFIEVKRLILNHIDPSLGNLYQLKVADAVDDDEINIDEYEPTITYLIIQNNFTLIDQDLREILEFDYNSYNYIQKKLVG